MTGIGLEPTNFCIIREYAHICDKATSDWRFVLMHVCDITKHTTGLGWAFLHHLLW